MRWIAGSCCLLMLLGVAPCWAAPRADLPEAIYSAEREFLLPFELEVADSPPAVVQLYVSNDAGTTWQLSAATIPDKTNLRFRAPSAGEYCFAIRTINQDGSTSSDPLLPEMRVVVGSASLPGLAGISVTQNSIQTVSALSPVPPPKPLEAVAVASPSFTTLPAVVIPSDIEPRMVNSLTFELDYNVDHLESSEVSRVELWSTADGGATWQLHGVDQDCQSPMKVRVNREGLFGFWMVIEDTTGLRGNTPSGGQQPQVWVGVDTSSPVARLTTAQMRTGPTGSNLTIQWEAVDMRLAVNPISLWYAAEADGPWSPLVEGLSNMGSFTTADLAKIPEQFFLQMKVVDAAGNERIVVTNERIRLVPTGMTLQASLHNTPVREMTWFHVLR